MNTTSGALPPSFWPGGAAVTGTRRSPTFARGIVAFRQGWRRRAQESAVGEGRRPPARAAGQGRIAAPVSPARGMAGHVRIRPRPRGSRWPRHAALAFLFLVLILAAVPALARAAPPPEPDRPTVGTASLPPRAATRNARPAPGRKAAALPADDFVILESSDAEPAKVVAGNPALADRPFCPASTFKIVLAWVALERGVVASTTRLDCRDPHLGPGTFALDLHQALLYSSNAFFRAAAPKAGRPAIEEFLRRSGYASPDALAGWLGKDWAPVVKGGKLRLTPRQQQAFLERLAAGRLPDPAGVRNTLIEALRWPSPDPAVELFGKTGTHDGAVWFAGFGRTGPSRRIVTVFCRGTVARRPAVIAAFYNRFGLTWSDALLPSLR